MGVSPTVLIITITTYFLLLYAISYFTSKGADTKTFFNADKQSHWLLVAIGMIGASLSGATFISIPGKVGASGLNMAFSYMQVVMGYLMGYAFIAMVLLPLYYKLNLLSIYEYLEKRFGVVSYKMGAFFFIISRIVGASFRLFLMTIVLHPFVLEPLGVSFEMTILITLILIWVYTFRGGIKTIVWTDTLQTVTMLLAVALTVYFIIGELNIGFFDIKSEIVKADMSQMFFFENGWADNNNFFKQFLSGALITIVMTGLDQDMMQKNLTCRSLKDAQKNMFVFSIILVVANLLFLTLGAMLYIYASQKGIAIPESTDQLYPLIALENLPSFVGIVFIIGLIAAAYSSADSALTSLTTSFCIDFLDFQKKERTEKEKRKTRLIVHVAFTVILFISISIFNQLNNDAVINNLLKAAGYTYGPLLGLFAFGLFTKLTVKDKWVWIVVLLSPLISAYLDLNSETIFNGFKFGFTILALNGLITFLGLLSLSVKTSK
ncbi:MAG: sodium:solute symporter [Saprospiraceae bacterium]|nr:sodium:solute symporter [Bacteroidia bacterium]NNE16074.1 sodium:solute symporter [Saprospiraceae bacterium]NNL91241.1 sodium:solute symporter [Saprospiraceae bacterium]